jgi:hypothetical protein
MAVSRFMVGAAVPGSWPGRGDPARPVDSGAQFGPHSARAMRFSSCMKVAKSSVCCRRSKSSSPHSPRAAGAKELDVRGAAPDRAQTGQTLLN